MKISTKGRYGLRAMLDLAIYAQNDHVTLSSVAERQDISANYLEQIFSVLRKAKLIKSVKGPQGGYTLGDQAEKITVGDILRVLEGEIFHVEDEDLLKSNQANVELCLKNVVWDQMLAKINEFLDSITLADLVYEYRKQMIEQGYMYNI